MQQEAVAVVACLIFLLLNPLQLVVQAVEAGGVLFLNKKRRAK
jgi:hypothetical protein